MQIPRPYVVKLFNQGNPHYPISTIVVWTTTKGMALSYGKSIFHKGCTFLESQFLTAEQATPQDQQKYREKIYHGSKHVNWVNV